MSQTKAQLVEGLNINTSAPADALVINSSGNVGIGTSSPLALYRSLSIHGPANDEGGVLDLATANQSSRAYVFNDSNGLSLQTSTSHPILLKTNNSERLRIDSSGNVGIGLTSFSDRVEIAHADNEGVTFKATGTDGSTATQITYEDTNGGTGGVLQFDHDNNSFSFETAGSERMRIDSSGRVGIGTTSPGSYASSADDLVVYNSGSAGITIRSGSSNDGSIYFNDTDDGNQRGIIRYVHGDDALAFHTPAGESMRIDSSGRVGIGTTSPQRPLHVNGTEGVLRLTSTASGNNGFEVGVGTASQAFLWNAENSHIEIATNNTERMRIDSSGRLLVGQSSSRLSYAQLQVTGGSDAAGHVCLSRDTATPTTNQNIGSVRFTNSAGGIGAQIVVEAENNWAAGSSFSSRLVFATTANGASSPTERMRITSSGATKSSTDGTYYTTNNTIHELRVNNANNWIALATNKASNAPHGLSIRYPSSAPNNTSSDVIHFEDSAATRFQLRSNGGLANFQSNNANLCDEREKKNIVSLDTKWDKVKSWELKKFHYNDDADTDDKRYGVIAQQVEEHCPEVLTEWLKKKAEDAVLDEDGNVVTPAVSEVVRKGVKEQQMMWMAIKALQEAQARIETLEQRLSDAGIA